MSRTRFVSFILAVTSACAPGALPATDAGSPTADAGSPREDASPQDGGTPTSDAPSPDPLQAALDGLASSTIARRGLMGIGIHVRLPDGRALHASGGEIEPGGAAYDAVDSVQVLGSVTKLYTATMILQLVEEGRLSLDDTIDAWVDLPLADQITIRHLLQHRSGLNEYITGMTAEERMQPWTPEALIDRAVSVGPIGPIADTHCRYTNTNFTVLALILEAVTERSWSENLHERITGPLGLTHTDAVNQTDETVIPGWMRMEDTWQPTIGLVDPSLGWGVGNLTTNGAELFAFAEALVAGELFEDPNTASSMTAEWHTMDPATLHGLPPGTSIGLALHRFEIDGVVLIGHMGHILGYDTAVLRDADTGALITVTTNTEVSGAAALTAYDIAVYLRAH